MSTTRDPKQDPATFNRLYEGAIVRAVESAHLPYKPGVLARYYDQLRPEHRESVNEEVNRIFRQRTGVTKKLDPKRDKREVRQWLRLRDVVVARRVELRGVAHDIEHRWALRQVNLQRNMFEIDIDGRDEEAPVIQPAVVSLIFQRGKLPKGFQLNSWAEGDHDVWRITWDGKVNLAQHLNWRFVNVVCFPKSFDDKWRAKSKVDRQKMLEGRLRRLAELHQPMAELGGWTQWDILQLPKGNYEIRGVCFVSNIGDLVWIEALSRDEKHNEAIRWFLRRDVWLPRALSINSKQQNGLYKQALAGSIIALSAGVRMRSHGAKIKPHGSLNQSSAQQQNTIGNTARRRTFKEMSKDRSNPDLISIMQERVTSTSEREAQSTVDMLAQKYPVGRELKVLEPKR